MFCTKCGARNADDAAFCVNCGNNLQSTPPTMQQPQVQYAPPTMPPQAQYTQYQGYAPQQNAYAGYPGTYPYKKRSNGLMIGLIAGGVALVALIVVLIIVLTGGGAAGSITGTWYDTAGYAGTLQFNSNGTVDISVMGMTTTADYTFNSAMGSGEIDIMGFTSTIYIEGGNLYYGGTEYTKNYVEQSDLSDIDLSDYGFDFNGY